MNPSTWPFIFTVAGALIFAFVKGPASELGKWTFVVGIFWLCAELSHGTLRF